jgi:hypothetical protein
MKWHQNDSILTERPTIQGVEEGSNPRPTNSQRQGPSSAGLVTSSVTHPDNAPSRHPRKFSAPRVDFHEPVRDTLGRSSSRSAATRQMVYYRNSPRACPLSADWFEGHAATTYTPSPNHVNGHSTTMATL